MTWTIDLTHELASGTYEITVVGALGPVLRAAMQPFVATTSGHCTTLRAALRPRGGMADLLAALDARGLEVTHMAEVTPPAVRRPTPRPVQTAGPIAALHPARVKHLHFREHGLERWPRTRR